MTTFENNGGIEQVIGREAGTATFFSRCLFTLGLRVARSRPRQCRRWAAILYLKPLHTERKEFNFSYIVIKYE